MTSLWNMKRKSTKKKLLRLNKLHDLKVTVSLHGSLKSCKGVVRCPDLNGVNEREILEEMREQGVINVRRIKIRRDGTLRDTNTFVFTFNTSILPKQLKIAFLRVSVDPYIPNPLRCYACQVFGHHENKCHRKELCANCGQPKHSADETVNAHQSALTARKTTPQIQNNARSGIRKKKFLKLSIPGTYGSQKRGKLLTATRQRRVLVSQYHVLMLRHKQTLYLSQRFTVFVLQCSIHRSICQIRHVGNASSKRKTK